MSSTSTFIPEESPNRSPPLQDTENESPLHVNHEIFKLPPLCLDLEWDFAYDLLEKNPDFLLSFASPGNKAPWFPKQDIMGAHFPNAGPPG